VSFHQHSTHESLHMKIVVGCFIILGNSGLSGANVRNPQVDVLFDLFICYEMPQDPLFILCKVDLSLYCRRSMHLIVYNYIFYIQMHPRYRHPATLSLRVTIRAPLSHGNRPKRRVGKEGEARIIEGIEKANNKGGCMESKERGTWSH
jgi:hypothetical protein